MGLADKKIGPAIPASDMERAKKFYKEKLGLKMVDENPGGTAFECGGGTGFMLFYSPRAGSNPMTYAGWEVDDVEAEAKALKAKGVTFEEYDTPNYKTKGGVATMSDGSKVAWFKDSEGNILAISQIG